MRLMLTTGFCGGYTTFSSYSYETAALIEGGAYSRAAIYSLVESQLRNQPLTLKLLLDEARPRSPGFEDKARELVPGPASLRAALKI